MTLFEFFSVPSIKKHEETKFNNPADDKERQELANELFYYIIDHDDLHKEQFIPIAQAIHREFKKNKKVDKSKYIECWMPMVRQACLEFHKKMKINGNPKKIFDKKLCEHLCRKLADHYIKDITKGEYNLG